MATAALSVLRPPPPLPPAPATPICSDLERMHDDCRRGHKSEVLNFIGENKKLVNEIGNLGFTALHWAAQTGHLDIVELLLQSGADVNAINANGDTPLHLASWKKHPLVVLELLKGQWKASLAIKNHDGKTAEELARTDEIREAFAKLSASQIEIVQENFEDDSDDD